ncbi:hypothetical protein [Nocardioides limicola]|uniref:hypothetical protein n=1 Tax=Nocardioides limicola TaxID=2803368 RepID=UPI00193C4B25|nr:hypothetical protein [Nocardioides sp. DJM-14]
MTLLWLALTAALLGVLWSAGRLADTVIGVEWPGETPLATREERARDQRLTQLVRLVGSRDQHETHKVVTMLAARLHRDSDSRVRRFLTDPPLADPDRYRQELTDLLAVLEEDA